MTRITDGRKTVEITMYEIDETGRRLPDWSNEFFEIGGLPLDEERDAYIVDDVDYCIDQAMEWKAAQGEWAEGTSAEKRFMDCV